MADSLSTPVQELVKNGGDDVPVRYVYKGGEGNDDFASTPVMDVPTVDVGLLESEDGVEELGKLRSALASWGCFQAINHGMTSSFLDEVWKTGKNFFALPIEEKMKCSRTAADMEGYGNDSVLSEHQSLDWTDRLFLNVYPEDQRKLHLWPENPENFREILHEYINKVGLLSKAILKAMARSLNLEETSFLVQYGDNPTMVARFNFYPPCPRPDLALGVKPHADGSAITFLLQDKEVEGLQVSMGDRWFRVPNIPHAIFINVGDQVEITSNGKFKSPMHRVVTNKERERMTLAVFWVPEPDREIGPLDELVSDGNPKLYRNITNYVNLYFSNYQVGKRPIDVAKL